MLDEDFNAILHNFAFIWFSDSCFSLLNTRKPKDVGIFIEDRVKNYFFFFFLERERFFHDVCGKLTFVTFSQRRPSSCDAFFVTVHMGKRFPLSNPSVGFKDRLMSFPKAFKCISGSLVLLLCTECNTGTISYVGTRI